MVRKLFRNFDTKPKALFLAMFTMWVAVFAVSFITMPKDAHALRVTLKRIVFEGPKRTETLTIMNNKATEQTYRLGWKRFRMTEDAALRKVDEGVPADDLKEAKDMIRYAPRRVTIPPGGSQQVRLMLRRPKDLADGEYRSHLWIVPEASTRAFTPDGERPDDSAAIKLEMLTGLSLPVFVRVGKLEAGGKISEVKFGTSEGDTTVEFYVERTGNRSLYGDFDLTCVGGDGRVLTISRGVAVYEEVARRKISLEFPAPEGGAAACPNVRIRYRSDEDDSFFKGETIAEATVPFSG
jgi:P pilus assembly chaperone PapD